jgi:hypothetical protein
MGGRVSESKGSVVPVERIESRILLVRGHKVLLDADLAALYGVETRVLNQAVKRNRERFPADFMFRLSAKELEAWRSHLEEHEKKFSTHDQAIAGLMNTIRTLMAPPEPPRRRPIGFVNPDEKKRS